MADMQVTKVPGVRLSDKITATLADIDSVMAVLRENLYPVGSIVMYTSDPKDCDPNKLIGGSWQRITDRFLLAAGTTYQANTTGGAATHNHRLPLGFGSNGNAYGWANGSWEPAFGSWIENQSNGFAWASVAKVEGRETQLSISDNASTMPPYQVVYVWQRYK